TSTVTDRPSRITLKVTSKARDPGLQQSQESLLCRTFPRPRSPRGRGSYCTIRVKHRATQLRLVRTTRRWASTRVVARPREREEVASSINASPGQGSFTTCGTDTLTCQSTSRTWSFAHVESDKFKLVDHSDKVSRQASGAAHAIR